jgi:hypothetical protein
MKFSSLLVVTILGLNLAAHNAKAAVLVTGFGAGEFTSTSAGFTTETQTATTYRLSGTDFGMTSYGDVPSPVNITGSTSFLILTASFSGTATGAFGIELYDALGNTRLYSAPLSDYTPQNVFLPTYFSFVSQTGAFNNVVQGLGFLTSGTGSTVDITMDKLEATPEPTSTALMLVGIVSLVARRRRQVN